MKRESLPVNVVTLVPDRLYAIMGRLEIDGSPISSHPIGLGAATTVNCYLAIEPDAALLLDTGLTAHEDGVLAAVADLLGDPQSRPLTLAGLRLSEFSSIANFRSLVDRFEVAHAFGLLPVADWIDVRSDRTPFGTPLRSGAMEGVACHLLTRDGEIEIGAAGRALRIIRAELQTLPSHWLYDEATRTLFTNEIFGWTWSVAGQPVGVERGAAVDPDDVRRYLVESGKYWWLRGAGTAPLRKWLTSIEDEFEIERIAPAFGSVLEGSEHVAVQFEVLRQVLQSLETETPNGPSLLPTRTNATTLGAQERACPATITATSSPLVEPSPEHPLPREIVPGIFWLGTCTELPIGAEILHTINSQYLVTGSSCSLLVECGGPTDLEVSEPMLERSLEAGAPPLRYIFPTHPETPHAGGMSRLLERFPDAVACGDPTDLLLVFPWIEDRIRELPVGAAIDLGDTEFTALPAVLRDHSSSRWGFDSSRRALFVGDGLAYSHIHRANQCGRLAEEVPELDLQSMTALFSDAAFYWTHFVDMQPYIDRFEEMLAKFDVEAIAPTHGLPMLESELVLPRVYEGLRLGAAATQEAFG